MRSRAGVLGRHMLGVQSSRSASDVDRLEYRSAIRDSGRLASLRPRDGVRCGTQEDGRLRGSHKPRVEWRQRNASMGCSNSRMDTDEPLESPAEPRVYVNRVRPIEGHTRPIRWPQRDDSVWRYVDLGW